MLLSDVCTLLWARLDGNEVLVASHDSAFLEALEVTEQLQVIRGSLGQPGMLNAAELN